MIIEVAELQNNKVQFFKIELPTDSAKLTLLRWALEAQRENIVNELKDMRSKNLIKSIKRPKNWTIKDYIDDLKNGKNKIRTALELLRKI